MSCDPKDLREGDRVRITLCGEVQSPDGPVLRIAFDGTKAITRLVQDELAHAEITRLDPPIREGDLVELPDCFRGRVRAVVEAKAWVCRADNCDRVYDVSSLTRIEGEAK